ncbi:MAG: RcpC/CpaB family pilus assembly protein [Actinomycetota bacterium]
MAVSHAARIARPSWANLRTVIGLLLFCGSLLAGQRVLEGASGTVEVWVAARDLPASTALAPSDLRPLEARLSGELLGRYATVGTPIEGVVLTRPVLEGEMIAEQALSDGPAAVAGRSISIPVDPEHAVGSDLRVGDRVDVLASFDSGDERARTKALVRGIEILDLVKSGGLVMGEESVVALTVAATPEESARLAFAIRNAELDVVRVDGVGTSSGEVTVRAGDFR